MITTALRMLLGDHTKPIGLIFSVAFSTLLICQQVSIFFSLLGRASSVVNVREANVRVMDPSVKMFDAPFPLRDTELGRVRGVEGVAWAVPFFKAQVQVRTRGGDRVPLHATQHAAHAGRRPGHGVQGMIMTTSSGAQTATPTRGSAAPARERAGRRILGRSRELHRRRWHDRAAGRTHPDLGPYWRHGGCRARRRWRSRSVGDALFRVDSTRARADLAVAERRVDASRAEVEALRDQIPTRHAEVSSAEDRIVPSGAGIESARATLAAAESDLADRRNLVRIAEAVDDPRAISGEELDNRRFAAKSAEARVEEARAMVSDAQAK